ncbi:MAG TPA: hypothetical protein VFT93_05970, partial [Candidatus Eisenbacteria bacterium]|nr:hypothetical protein [Candidatus Eisenbacteria bacterium]
MAAIEPEDKNRSLFLPLLRHGVIAIPGGISSAAISFYPAFTITPQQLTHAIDVVTQCAGQEGPFSP